MVIGDDVMLTDEVTGSNTKLSRDHERGLFKQSRDLDGVERLTRTDCP